MPWPNLSIIIFSDADPGGCVRVLTDCERLEHEGLEFEVIMVLQGLTDKVEAMLKSYSYSYEIKFLAVDVDTNRAAGRNRGAAEAKYDMLLFLDSSLEVSPKLLYRHLEPYDDQNVVAVMGEIFLPEFVKKSRWLRFMDSNYRSTRRWSAVEGTKSSPPLRYVNTSNFSVRKRIYTACDGHAETIDNHEAENVDLAHRISALNKGIIRYEPEAITYCQHAPLKMALTLKYEFGLEGVPKLLNSYPTLYSILPSRFVKPEGTSVENPVFRSLMALLFSSPILFIARGLRLLGPEAVSFRMLRYMLQYESVRGFRASINK